MNGQGLVRILVIGLWGLVAGTTSATPAHGASTPCPVVGVERLDDRPASALPGQVPVPPGADAVARGVLHFALSRLGASYSMVRRFGPRTYDCSSFIYLAYQAAGVRVAQTTQGWLTAGSAMRRYEVRRGRHRPGDVILVPRRVLNKHFAVSGRRPTGFNHALLVAETDPLTGRVTRVVDASGGLGVTFRPAPAYVHDPGVRFYRPR